MSEDRGVLPHLCQVPSSSTPLRQLLRWGVGVGVIPLTSHWYPSLDSALQHVGNVAVGEIVAPGILQIVPTLIGTVPQKSLGSVALGSGDQVGVAVASAVGVTGTRVGTSLIGVTSSFWTGVLLGWIGFVISPYRTMSNAPVPIRIATPERRKILSRTPGLVFSG